MARNKNKFWLQVVVGLLVAVGGWAIFNFVRLILQNTFANIFGITSEAGQSLAMVVLVVVILASLGIGFRKSIQRLVS